MGAQVFISPRVGQVAVQAMGAAKEKEAPTASQTG